MDVSGLIPAGLQEGIDLVGVQANYNKLSENFRKLTPIGIQCAIFCGGSRCKYESSKFWTPVHMAIQGIFSHWVTDEVLAMARPSQLKKKKLIEQFQTWNIKTIINLQTPGEHSNCGGSLKESGFTYEPSEFMKNGIYYYNFAWKDYDDATTGKLLDMVKVVAFGVEEGRVAIHCHAGLGRTGVLIACYLIYSLRVRASDAIRFVRKKRPGAIQTRGQIKCIKDFEHYALPQMIIYSNCNSNNRKPSNLQTYLKKQWNMLHGYEQRTFKYIPKIVFVLCERILQLCDCHEDNSPTQIDFSINETAFTNKFISNVLDKLDKTNKNMKHSYSWAECLSQAESVEYSSNLKTGEGSVCSSRDTSEDIRRMDDVFCTSPESPSCSTAFPALDDNFVDDVLGDGIHDQELYDNDCYKEIQSQMALKARLEQNHFECIEITEVVRALLNDELKEDEKKVFTNYQIDLNNRNSTWQRLELETNIRILIKLLYEWLESLKTPVLDTEILSQIVIRGSKPLQCLQKIELYRRHLLEYLMRFISRLRPMTMDTQILIIKRIVAALTHQTVRIKQNLLPSGKSFQKLRGGTAGKLLDFFLKFLNLIEEINTNELNNQPWFQETKWHRITSSRLQDIKDEENDDF